MSQNKKYDIFISYRKSDNLRQAQLIRTLLAMEYPNLDVSLDSHNLHGKWFPNLVERIDTCKKFIVLISENSLHYPFHDTIQESMYIELAQCSSDDIVAKVKELNKNNVSIDYFRLEIARMLSKKDVTIVPVLLAKGTELFTLDSLNLPQDLADLKDHQLVSFIDNKINTEEFDTIIPSIKRLLFPDVSDSTSTNAEDTQVNNDQSDDFELKKTLAQLDDHRSNTSPITTIFPDIDRHLFSEKFKPYNNIFRYIMNILSKNWQWTITILALICVLGMWLQRSSGIMPNLKLPKTDKAVTSIDNKNAAEVHKYVDLGLSVKWATCNLGAYSLIEKGSTFSWGEVMRGKYHNWESYKYSEGNSSYVTKYCDNEVIGVNDRKTTLELSDDAAYVNWGTDWRIPTEKEFSELLNECSWKLDSINNVKGYQVIGKNGNSIFLPFCERISHSERIIGYTVLVTVETHVSAEGEGGYYWTSSIDVNNPQKAWGFVINSNICGRSSIDRYMGLYIRPVYCGK